MLNRKRFFNSASEQGQLLPTYTSDLVPEDHLARVINEVVDVLDLTPLYQKYSSEGGKTYHPKPMLKILFYAYAEGIRSSRKISKACRENFVFIYLSAGYKPDHRTISDFRKNNINIVKQLFKQIVKLCYQLGMITIGKISIDGTKIKANASNNNVIRKDDLEKELTNIEEQISQMFTEAESVDKQEDITYGVDKTGEELPDDLQKTQARKRKIKELLAELDKQGVDKMNLHEPEARFMKHHGRIELSYNAQAVTENQVIIAYNLNNNEVDKDQLEPLIDELEETASELLEKDEYPLENVKAATDAGYNSGKNLKRLNKAKIDAYIPSELSRVQAKERHGEIPPRRFTKDKFRYHEKGNYYECPTGKKLLPVGKRTVKLETYTRDEVVYKGQACHQCPYQKDCTTSKTGYRQVSRFSDYDRLREQMDQKLKTEIGKAMLKYRLKDIEPTFAQIKQAVFGHSPFLLSGVRKTNGEFGLSCIVHNIKKIRTYLISTNNNTILADIATLKLRPT